VLPQTEDSKCFLNPMKLYFPRQGLNVTVEIEFCRALDRKNKV
jgi:hypothetical protein